jgi:hypothetical protein
MDHAVIPPDSAASVLAGIRALARPSRSYAVLLIGVEVIDTQADPVDGDVADRAGQAQDGQDPAVPGFLAERVARDRALALDWLLAEVRLLPELQRARAAHALGLARAQPAAGAAYRLTGLNGQLRPGPDGCPGPQSGDSHPG